MDTSYEIEEWFNLYSDDVYNFLVYYTGSKEVDDLVQDVFIRAIKNGGRFEARSNPKTWLISIARNIAIDHFRKKRWERYLPEKFFIKQVSGGKQPEEQIIFEEEKNDLYTEIMKLKQSYRDVLVMRGILEMSVEDTMNALRWSEAKVVLTFHRARKALKKQMMNVERGKIDETREQQG
ncbi:RNA polymerase sigma factor [Pseudalkalibacillus caeni]|uniref:RNA polymerase sigma factor n=1 Tax=Exobacillus caeni TaxID=2574798 RepID=A0A5R9F3E2_9BACL|nr:RNA polymerase sigma factor [Pseudalkalibacillus caeni]TLS38202.1 RNA polymerase sigma factor [Pseudalkalibacillus caeni]